MYSLTSSFYRARRQCPAAIGTRQRTYHVVYIPHALRAGCLEVAGDNPLHARDDRRLEDWLLLEGRLRVDRAQEDVDALQVLGELSGWVRGAVADADLDAAYAQGVHGRFGCRGRARQGRDVLWTMVSAGLTQERMHTRVLTGF